MCRRLSMALPVEVIACPLCQKPEYQVIYPHIDRIDTSGTQVVRCSNCSLVYLNPRLRHLTDNFTLSEAYLLKFYLPDQQRLGRLTAKGQIDHEKNLAFHARQLDQMRSYRVKNRVLDVGCAIGLFLAAARLDGWDGYGVEPSKPLSDYGRQHFKLDIYQGELHERAFPDGHFDVVTLWEVAEHLMDPMDVFSEVYRVLRPGGLLLLSFPNWNDIARETLENNWDNFVTDHFQFFTQATMRQALLQVGFTGIRTTTERPQFREIAQKLSQRTAQNVQRKLALSRSADKGSTLIAAAEKPQSAASINTSAIHDQAHSRPVLYMISGCNIGTAFEYRVLHKQEQLAYSGIESIARQYSPRRDIKIEESLSCNVLYLYRIPFDSFIEDLIERARARGIPVVFDTDDLIFEPDLVQWVDSLKSMSHDEAALYYEGVWRYRRTLLACDAVVTSTDYLADLARVHGKLTFVHRNALSEALIQIAEPLYTRRQIRQPNYERLIIGYVSGTATHNKDFLEASPALAQILEHHPQVELHILGPLLIPPELTHFGERVRNLPLVYWTEVPHILNTFDINLGPLEQGNPFCRCKSEVKYIEAAILGIPTVASRIDAFEFAIRDGENGLLAGDADEWVEKLEQLLADPASRHRIGTAARSDVLARYAPAVRSPELVQTLESIQKLYAIQAPTPTTAADPRTTPLVLNWLLPEPVPGSGGHTTIIGMMNRLASLGHQINVYILPYKRLLDKSDLEIRDYVRRHFEDLEGHMFKWTGGPMAESDAVILTYWDTAYTLGDARNTSKVFYFVQDWEPFFYPMGVQYLRVEQTYKMGFSCITAGPWLTRHLRQLYGADADYFDLAVDHKVYYPRPVDRPSHPRICFYTRPSTPRRLVPLGIAALGCVHERRSDTEIVFYGATDAELIGQSIPFPYTNRGILTEAQMAELFNSSDVGLVFSPTNCSRVPLEMMACKCAVVDLDRETVKGVLEHEVNALLVEPEPEVVANAILRLLEDQLLRQRLVEIAYQQVQERSWEKSARRVEEILYQKLPASRRVLTRRRFVSSPTLPSATDLPPEHWKHLDAIRTARRRWRARWRASLKSAVRPLLQITQRTTLDHKEVFQTGELTGQNCIGQTFVARSNNLHRIDVLISTFGRRNTGDVILHLRESPAASDDLAIVRVNASLLLDNSYCHFVFEPQVASRHKSYYFRLDSPESVPGDAIAFWAYHSVKLSDAQFYKNGLVMSGQLIFGDFYMDGRLGEVGARPLLHNWVRATTFLHRAVKAYRLLVSGGLPALIWEIQNYWRWKTAQ
jgi:glycosyltransferase involved in cell wall biosynthesis/SAM-dependent methyltransferase